MSILIENTSDDSRLRARVPMLFLMVLVLLLAYSFGLFGLNADVIWADELSSLTHMGAFNPPYTPQQVLESISLHARDHVPLFYMLGAGWSHWAGWSQFAMRYIALLAGTMMIAAFYGFTRATVDKRTALLASILLANNAFALVYFHEIRGYTLLLLLAIIHFWLYWRLNQERNQSQLVFALFVLTGAAMLYTHVISIIMLASLGASHIVMERRTKRSWVILIGWIAILLLFSPYLWTMLSGIVTWGATERAVVAQELTSPLLELLTNGLGALFIPLILNLVYQQRRKEKAGITKLLLLTGIMGIAFLLVSWMFDLIALSRMRYFLLLWFPCIILIAYSITLLSRSIPIVLIFVIIWILAGFSLGRSEKILPYLGFSAQTKSYPPLHRYSSLLQGKVSQGDYMVGFSNSLSVNQKREGYNWSVSDYYLDAQLGIDGAFLHSHLKRYRLTEDTRAILAEHPHILLAHDPSDVPPNYPRVLSIINDALAPCHTLVDEPRLSIRKYVRPLMGCDHQPAPIDYANGIRLIDRAATYDADAQLIQVLTWWHVPDDDMLDQYNISLQILDRHWQNRRQNDRHLYELSPWAVRELSTADLPPASYQLALILYHRDSGAKVPGVAESGGESAGIIPILPFTIDS